MDLFKFFKDVMANVESLEERVERRQKFTPGEMSEILQNARKENVGYLESLSKINRLSAFDTSFLLSSVKLNPERLEIIKEAAKMYNDEEFKAEGQTFSDFIFKVAANIELLNSANLELFKDLAKCKTNVYDFKNVLKNPSRYMQIKKDKAEFAFQRVFY